MDARPERRRRRSRRRRWIALGVTVTVVLAVGGVVLAVRDGSGHEAARVRARAPDRSAPTTTPSPVTEVPTTAAPAPEVTAAPAPAGPPYGVEVARTTVVDTSRPTAARGPTPASPTRSLPVTVSVPSAPGPFPLVVFAHGFDISAADYADFQRDLAAQGFVVVAPDFPLSSTAFPGPPTQSDIDEQARDVAFLVDELLDDRVPGIWSGRVAPVEAGVVGHSDGGNTVARAASNSCCVTPRIGAAAVLSGDEGTSGGQWGVAGAPPILLVQGTADAINPWSFSQRLYDDAAPPKTLVAIDGADHLAPYTTGPQRPAVVALVAAFLRGHLTGDTAAQARVADLANRDGLRVAASS